MTVSETAVGVWTEGFRLPNRLAQYEARAWNAHHSPDHFEVAAELVAADPPDGCGDLVNGDAAHGRVVLVARGGCPLVTKATAAQRAGRGRKRGAWTYLGLERLESVHTSRP